MGRKKRAKTGGYEVNAFKQGRGAPESEGNDEQVEEDFIALDVPQKGRDEDEEESGGDDTDMFDLGQGVSSSSESDNGQDGSESDSDSDDSDDGDSEDDNGMGEDEENLRALADNLPASLRQKVLLGKTNFDSDDDGDGSGSSGDDNNDDEGVKGVASWGKKKSYYTGDTADLEIGQDVQDAIDEEEAALSLQQERLESKRESDFLDDDNSDGEGTGEEEDAKESKPKKRSNKNSVIGSLESIVLDEVSSLELCITNTFATNERSLSDMTNA
jgi:hypothetical protein